MIEQWVVDRAEKVNVLGDFDHEECVVEFVDGRGRVLRHLHVLSWDAAYEIAEEWQKAKGGP